MRTENAILAAEGSEICHHDSLGMDKNDNKQAIAIAIRTSESLRYDLANGMGANRYAGLDRFGRIIDLAWRKAATGSSSSSSSSSNDASALVHLQYGYDRASNRTYRRDDVARSYGKNFDELYEYDGLNQLKKFYRGLLVDNNTVIESPALQQAWQFDATGNWSNFTSFDPADATKALDQQRLHNRVNEITEIARTVGTNWATPTYDRNGNMTSDETGKLFVYDAWNRLKVVKDAVGTTLKTYNYDALNRRVRDDDGSTTNLYYSLNWQVLEEHVASEVTNQYVWSLTYIDAMVLRDRAVVTLGVLDERLWVTQDANFNIVALLDGNGLVVERYTYDPFGAVTIYRPDYSTVRASSLYSMVYLWQERPIDSISGTYHFRNREVSWTLGRPIQLDPIRFRSNDVNFYRWEGNDPVGNLDPSGLKVILRCWPVVRAGITLGWHCGVIASCCGKDYRYDGGGNATVGRDPKYPDRPMADRTVADTPIRKRPEERDFEVESPWKSCENEVKCLENAYNRILMLPYRSTGPNSNTYSHALLSVCNMRFKPIKVTMPGHWDSDGLGRIWVPATEITLNSPPGAVAWDDPGYGGWGSVPDTPAPDW
ncbi:MAG: hypothetical protein LC104_19875 [Bacteroidales bacterium]|nr:hypothetical protein [Bacteroidales bacterium]